MSTFVVVVLALGVGLGVTGAAFALWRRPIVADPRVPGALLSKLPGRRRRGWPNRATNPVRSLVPPAVVAIILGVSTRWPVVAVLGALASVALPAQFVRTSTKVEAHKVEAIAVWTELLRDTLAASAGLSQAIVTTAASAPAAIHEHVALLAGRVMNGVPVEAALRSFAREVDDSSADMVVCALILAATSRAQRLVELLSALAEATREDVAMRLRVDASRASARSSVRTVIVFSVAFAGLLLVVAHSYLAPFGSVTGQLVLGAVGALYAAGLVLMVRMVRPRPGLRLLDTEQAA